MPRARRPSHPPRCQGAGRRPAAGVWERLSPTRGGRPPAAASPCPRETERRLGQLLHPPLARPPAVCAAGAQRAAAGGRGAGLAPIRGCRGGCRDRHRRAAQLYVFLQTENSPLKGGGESGVVGGVQGRIAHMQTDRDTEAKLALLQREVPRPPQAPPPCPPPAGFPRFRRELPRPAPPSPPPTRSPAPLPRAVARLSSPARAGIGGTRGAR